MIFSDIMGICQNVIRHLVSHIRSNNNCVKIDPKVRQNPWVRGMPSVSVSLEPETDFYFLICSAVNLHCLWLLKYREREINIIGLAHGQNHPWQCARQAFEIIGAYPRVWGIKIIPRLFAREREAQCPGLKGRVPHGSANWLRRSDTGISFCRGEEEEGGVRRRRRGRRWRWEVCVYLRWGFFGGGVNNSNNFPNLAQSGMWMAALERNCNGFIWLSVCFFIGRRERKGGSLFLVRAVRWGRMLRTNYFIQMNWKSFLYICKHLLLKLSVQSASAQTWMWRC